MTGTILTLAAGDKPNPVAHAVNHPWWITDDGWWLWTAHTGNIVLTGLIMLIGFPIVARHVSTGPESQGHDRYVTKNILSHMIEVICVYLRDKVVEPLLHERTARFMPFLWTLFFFILINNILGLIPIIDLLFLLPLGLAETHSTPIGGTATQNLFVTGALAFVSFLVINIAGIRQLGMGGYLKHLTGGAPPAVAPLLIVIESLGILIKPIALALRLFANMTAGHILVATLFMFVGMALDQGLLIGAPVSLLSMAGAAAIYFLELFVAFLQAFVFVFLTTVFISLLAHHDHEHADHPSHDHGHQPALAH